MFHVKILNIFCQDIDSKKTVLENQKSKIKRPFEYKFLAYKQLQLFVGYNPPKKSNTVHGGRLILRHA